MQQKTAHYEEDFVAWTQEQAALLRAEQWTALDIANLAEELESLGKSEHRELEHRLDVLLLHLLKWRYQPSGRQTGHSWRATIREQRRQLTRLLRDSPSLRLRVPTLLLESYANARLDASDETGVPLETFPVTCPWTVAQVLHEHFWLDEPPDEAVTP
jgi:hypothetical protein